MRTLFAAGFGAVGVLAFPPASDAQSLSEAKSSIQKDMAVVESVEIGQDGWLVAHKAENGRPGEPIGFAPLKSGSNDDVQVPLAGTLEPGGSIILMLHEDTGEAGKFEFGQGGAEDKPVMEDGKPVMAEVKVE